MQLFITDFEVKENKIIINDSRIKEQLRKVLRAEKGYVFQVQKQEKDVVLRYTVSLDEFTSKGIIASLEKQQQTQKQEDTTGVVVAMLNKFDKMEIIVQKLSEIGVRNIIFTPSSRSIIRVFKDNKMERMKKISLEAIEQSKGWVLPTISFEKKMEKAFEGKKIVVLDMDGENGSGIKKENNTYLFIGPEGGISDEDMNTIGDRLAQKINIGDTVLRAETAAIIGARLIRQN